MKGVAQGQVAGVAELLITLLTRLLGEWRGAAIALHAFGAGEAAAIPDGVDIVGIRRVSSDRLLVVEVEERVVTD